MKNHFLIMLLILVGLACQQEKVKPKGPVEVEYRVLSSSGAAVAYISYTNETGGTTEVDDATLPFSVKFKFSQRSGPIVLMVILPDQAGQQQSVTGTILVDGQPAESETGNGASAAVDLVHILQP
jgi:hypothetical protein